MINWDIDSYYNNKLRILTVNQNTNNLKYDINDYYNDKLNILNLKLT
jgi:hypothetical protein